MNITETATKAGDALHLAQEEMENLGRTANAKFDEARNSTAEVLESTASSFRTTGHQGAEAIDTFSRNASNKLASTAAYMRDHDAGGMLRNLRHWMLRHPTGSMVLAVGIGFLAGSAITRNKSIG